MAQPALEQGRAVKVNMAIKNIHRTAGAMLSGALVKRHGPQGLPDGTVEFNFKGSAGQSFGAFLAPGVVFNLEGDANDYLGKGMSGGRIVVVPPAQATFVPEENIIAGNVILLRRHRRRGLPARPGRRALLRAQQRRLRRGGRPGRPRLRIHDRRLRGGHRPHGLQFRGRHERRRGVRLR